jgi:hypothetical protein
LTVISVFDLEDCNTRRAVPVTSVSIYTLVVGLTAFISVLDARYPVILTHVNSVLHNKEFAQCYGSEKMIRFSYSNEDTKDEERRGRPGSSRDD